MCTQSNVQYLKIFFKLRTNTNTHTNGHACTPALHLHSLTDTLMKYKRAPADHYFHKIVKQVHSLNFYVFMIWLRSILLIHADHKSDCVYCHYLPTRRMGRGPNLSIRIPSGSVVALSRKEPMVKPRFSISSWSTQLSHSSSSWPPEEELNTPDSFPVGAVVEGVIRDPSVNSVQNVAVFGQEMTQSVTFE